MWGGAGALRYVVRSAHSEGLWGGAGALYIRDVM